MGKNINKTVKEANVRAKVALETEVIKTVEVIEQKVMEHYFKILEPLQQGLDILYNELEKPNFTKIPRKEFDELVYENFQTRLGWVMINYSNNAHDLTLKIGREQQADEFLDFMQQYKADLLKQGVKPKRVGMEVRKILYTMSCRLVTMLNSFGDSIDKQFSSYCEYLLDSIDFYRRNYTVDVDAPKIEDIEVEIEREGYIIITDVRDMIELLLNEGYTLTRVSGSHHIYSNGTHSVPLPIHNKEMNKHLAYGIQKQVRENRLA